MDAIGQNLGLLVFGDFANAFCYCAIGEEHELFDEFVGVFCYFEIYAYGVSVGFDFESYFAPVEVDCSGVEAFLAQLFCYSVEDDEWLGEVFCRFCIDAVGCGHGC